MVTGCLAPPPAVLLDSSKGTIRAASEEEARHVSELLGKLTPALQALLPGEHLPSDLEVWVQDEPHLYAVPLAAHADAEGLFAPGHERILLARGADNLERVLAHELVHASLGGDWDVLPGTLEEGLCDVIATRLVPAGAARLRAGRLSSAALACGGLQFELEVRDRSRSAEGGARLGWSARITLSSTEDTPDAPLDVFRVAAGLSSTRVDTSVKRGYYGLAFLLVERVVERHGLQGLHARCRLAAEAGHDRLPRAPLLEAAGLGEERADWRRAAASAIGEAELIELVEMYPDSIAGALAHYLRNRPGTPEERFDSVAAELALVEGTARVELTDLDCLRAEVLSRLAP